MTNEKMTKPSRARGMLTTGIVLLVLGLIAMIPFGFGTPGPNNAGTHVAWESALIWVATILIGVGILLILIAVVKRTRRRAEQRRGRPVPDDLNPPAVDGDTKHLDTKHGDTER
jgi:protein-S-isoprenylcysteine O-methyltransferase Ste14